MGTTPSKNPDWYPGEPSWDLYGDCSCGPSQPSPKAPATRGKAERAISSLPIVELSGMKFVANGGYCSVFLCEYQGHSVVAKRVREDLPLGVRQVALNNLWTEMECLQPLRHSNIIDVYGLCRVRCREGYEDWNEKDVCLLLEELAVGTVGHLFRTIYTVEKNLSSAMAKSRLMKMVPFASRLVRALELALALEYLHEGSGVGVMMHRDIKSVNVGFAKNGSLKLMDFGLSKMMPIASKSGEETHLDSQCSEDTYQMTGEVGSYRYMAPEVVRHEPYNTKADVYSWAVLSWEMLAVEKPYDGVTESTFVKRVVIGGERPTLNKGWPDALRKLLTSAWDPDHRNRPTASQVVAALRRIKSQLPGRPQGSTGRRPSATSDTGASRRRRTWAAPTQPPRVGGVGDPPDDPTLRRTRSSTDDGDRPACGGCPARRLQEEASERLAAPSEGAAEEPENEPSGSKPKKRFSRLSRSSGPALTTSASYSGPSRRSWYKVGKRGTQSANARFAREAQDGSGTTTEGGEEIPDARPSSTITPRSSPKPSATGTTTTTTSTISSSLGSSMGRTLAAGENDGGGGGGGSKDPDSAVAPEDVVAGWDGRAGRCAYHQGLVNRREEIADALAREAEEQMPQAARRESPARMDGVRPSRDNQEGARNSPSSRDSAPSNPAGDAAVDPDHGSSAADVSDVSSRSNRRSNSVGKLWPLASPSSENPVPAPTSNVGGGDRDDRGGLNFDVATNGTGSVALVASE